MENYLQEHKAARYHPHSVTLPGLKKYTNRYGWDDFYIGRHLIFSHRLNSYDITAFPEKLHTHNFFEMDVYELGNISYIAEDHEIFPKKGDIIIFPPGVFHTGKLSEKSKYERYVLYFSTDIFNFLSHDSLPMLFRSKHASCRTVAPERKCELFYLLEKIEYTLRQEQAESGMLAFAYIMQLINLVSQHTTVSEDSISAIPDNILKIKTYVDENFNALNTTAEVADHFFYSREYVSRMFKQCFNINLSEYLVSKKISCAKKALEEGKSVNYAFDFAGYHSMSSFVNTFKAHTGMTPSEYRALHKPKKKAQHHALRIDL
jgi:AraC-like DNA-binding protein